MDMRKGYLLSIFACVMLVAAPAWADSGSGAENGSDTVYVSCASLQGNTLVQSNVFESTRHVMSQTTKSPDGQSDIHGMSFMFASYVAQQKDKAGNLYKFAPAKCVGFPTFKAEYEAMSELIKEYGVKRGFGTDIVAFGM